MNEKVDANEVIAELQSDIAEKALQIALLRAQLKDARKAETKPEEPAEGNEQ